MGQVKPCAGVEEPETLLIANDSIDLGLGFAVRRHCVSYKWCIDLKVELNVGQCELSRVNVTRESEA